jgi:TRAP-type mannitol/chloroaromatic compound transport system substrate-binding protein
MPVEPLGWYKKPIRSIDDFKGLKFRTVGLGIEMYTAMGAAVNALPGSEIVPALDRGLIDAAEFNNPSSDRALGFPDVSKVYMMQSFHQSCETFEILFNKTKYDALSDNLKSIIANAVEAASADMSWKAIDRYSQDYINLQAQDKVKVFKTPDSVLKAQLKIWDETIAKKAADNPWFQKVLDSQKAFAERAAKWQYDQNVDFRIAVNHYFGKKA